jgi:hypothetical protein
VSNLEEVLKLVGISPNQFRQRQQDLPETLAELHQSVLRAFVETGTVPREEHLPKVPVLDDLDINTALKRLEEADLIVRDQVSGRILGAYPFSSVPTRHRLELDNGTSAFAMCAIDALGIPFMTGRDATVLSQDPDNGEEICIHIRDARAVWSPISAVVVVASNGGVAPIASSCCVAINFFRSAEAAERYLGVQGSLIGRVLGQADALEAGRRMFGNLLNRPG